MRTLAVLSSLLIAVAVSACSAAAPDDANEATTADAAFTEGDYVQENDPHYWAPSTFEEFQAANQTLGSPPPQTLAEDDPLTVRLQAILDRVDGVVRAGIQAKTGTALVAPRPLARIIVSHSTFNAWVTGTAACVGAPFGASRADGSGAYMDGANVQALSGLTAGSCIHPAAWSTGGFVKFWNGGKPSCTLSQAGDVLNIGGKACAIDGTAAAGGEQLVVSATGQYVQFTTDLLSAVDEPTLVVVATHELGHYYRGHTTAKAQSRYNFWYQADANQKRTPVKAANAAALQASYAEVIQGVKPANGPSFSSKYSARLRPLLLSGVAPLLVERTEPDFACAAARDAFGPWSAEILQSEAPSDAAKSAYLAFESKLAVCAPKLGITGAPGARAISGGALLFAGAQYKPGPKTKVSISFSGDDVGSFLGRLDTAARDLDTKAAKLLQHMRDNQIGLYTVEQEADDFAMEIATKLGLSVDQVLQGWLQFMGAVDNVYAQTMTREQLVAYYQSIGEYDAADCKQLLADGFTKDDGTGKRVSVPMSLGQLDEPHHTSCYRLFNLAREAAAHHYVAGPAQPALTPAWDDLRAEAASLAATATQ